MSLSSGEILDGKYRIVRLIGEGGMGAVYEGENVRIHRRVAIKVLHSAVAANTDAVQRFEREAQAAGRIGSEHIVEVLDLGNLADGDRYMVMEFLDGETLSGRIHARGRLTPHDTVPVFQQVLEGLIAAHGAGIIHRDLKPENVFLLKTRKAQKDFVKILDFGISKFNKLSGESGFSMTRTGAVMGTPYYMSPEQAKGAKAMDHRADLYAVGVMLYEAITGNVPFHADTFNELLFKIVLEEPKPIEQVAPDCDPGFVAIIRKAMARDPNDRFQTAAEFQNALDSWANGMPVEAMRAPAARAAMPSAAPVVQQPGPQTLGTGTPGTWSSSGSFGTAAVATPAPKKSKGPLILALVSVAVFVVIGGVAVFAVARHSASGEPTVDSAAFEKAAAEKAAADKAAADKAAADKAAADQAAADKAAAEKTAAPTAAAEASKGESKDSPKTAASTHTRTTTSTSATARTAVKEPAKTDTKPAPTSTNTSSVSPATTFGRKIRTTL